jgi:hypothetical protein
VGRAEHRRRGDQPDTLLLTVPVSVFVGTKTVAAWILMCSGLVVTVSAAVSTARAEGLETAVGADGSLHAYVAPLPPDTRTARRRLGAWDRSG